jgi:hypothetical protein
MSAVMGSPIHAPSVVGAASTDTVTRALNGPPDSVASATERLAWSRRRLQIALAETIEDNLPRVSITDSSSPAWMDELKAIPGVGIAVQALSAWWAKYPLNAASTMAYDAANAVAKPLATRHPVPMVLGALVIGGMLAWSRPWRWILKPALFAGLMAQLSAKLVAQVPLQSWMSLLTAFAQGRPQGQTQAPSKAPAPTETSSAETRAR